MNDRTWLEHNKARVAGTVALLIGAVALLLGWLGVARSVYPAEQLTYLISGGLGGLGFVGVGTLLWLSADLRDEWTKLDRIEDAIRRLDPTYEAATEAVADEPAPASEAALADESPRKGRRDRRLLVAE